MSRAEQIKYKQATQKAKIQALKQAKADEVAAAEAQHANAGQNREQGRMEGLRFECGVRRIHVDCAAAAREHLLVQSARSRLVDDLAPQRDRYVADRF